MDMSDMIHTTRRRSESRYQRSPSCFASSHFTPRENPLERTTGPALASNPYSQMAPSYASLRVPQAPPSPPVEEGRCSLPSITTLFDSADRGPATYPEPEKHRARSGSNWIQQDGEGDGYRRGSGQPMSRSALPPTPPLHPDAVFARTQSPPDSPQRAGHNGQGYYTGSAINNVDASNQAQAAASRRPSLNTSQSYESSPTHNLNGSFYSPVMTRSPSTERYYQRPLPQSFPPSNIPTSATSATSPSLWEHHHYISPSSQAAFPPSQERYICPTCSKAFSRPSSLRIHTHSHTGEKPFKCSHHGCGKAFSVRSNMKRHERGCHSTSPSAASSISL